ncbi:hypothetical protein QQF64_024406 [Cirrhinus molitorella]|uniref:Uncharacterized protein n=1 Tax=Cirrhinus molitorella TaxID=172907 RepID=A0ABR3NM21_9TELE
MSSKHIRHSSGTFSVAGMINSKPPRPLLSGPRYPPHTLLFFLSLVIWMAKRALAQRNTVDEWRACGSAFSQIGCNLLTASPSRCSIGTFLSAIGAILASLSKESVHIQEPKERALGKKEHFLCHFHTML